MTMKPWWLCNVYHTVYGTHKGARAAGNYCPHVKYGSRKLKIDEFFFKLIFKFKIFSSNHIVTVK